MCCFSGTVCHACNSSVGVSGDWSPGRLNLSSFLHLCRTCSVLSRYPFFFTVTPFREKRWIMYRVAVNALAFCWGRRNPTVYDNHVSSQLSQVFVELVGNQACSGLVTVYYRYHAPATNTHFSIYIYISLASVVMAPACTRITRNTTLTLLRAEQWYIAQSNNPIVGCLFAYRKC
jgi:hypothetical protein